MSVQKTKKKEKPKQKVSKTSEKPKASKSKTAKTKASIKKNTAKTIQANGVKAKQLIGKAGIKTLNGKSKEKIVLVSQETKEPIEKALIAKRSKKTGKKNLIAFAPPPPMEVSNHPKTRVKQILVSQPKPTEADKNPYFELAKKHNLNVTFRQFIKVEGLTAQEFRSQRIEILEHGAVILTSKLAVDHFFQNLQRNAGNRAGILKVLLYQ